MVDSFGGRLPDSVRDRSRAKILHASRIARRLSDETQEWWANRPVRLELRPGQSGCLELVAFTDPLPPVEDWWLHANDALQNLRAALDQIHHAIWVHVVGTQPGRVYFPLCMSGSDFRTWRKVHRDAGFRDDLIERYRSIQPYVTGHAELRALAELTNSEKHRDGVAAGIDLSSLRLNFRAEFGESAPAVEDDIRRSLRASKVVHPVLDQPESVLLEFPWRHEVMPYHVDFEYEFTTSIMIDGDAVPLSDVMPRLVGAASAAVAFVSGLTDKLTPVQLTAL